MSHFEASLHMFMIFLRFNFAFLHGFLAIYKQIKCLKGDKEPLYKVSGAYKGGGGGGGEKELTRKLSFWFAHFEKNE